LEYDPSAELGKMTQTLRADLHVHTRASSVNGNIPFLKSRDCYSAPEDVYRVAKARGMDLVAITDHDSIDGALELLDRRPDADDVIVGEEVSCRFPEGDIEVHLGVYEMTESVHRQIQPLRGNVFDVTAFLREQGLFFSLNHLLHFYRGQAPLDHYLRLLDEVPAVEARNGTMVRAHNEFVERIAPRWPRPVRLGMIGGSDAHTLRRIGRTWTSVPGRTRAEFMAGLRNGLATPGGAHGGTWAVAGDAYVVIASYIASLCGIGVQDHAPLHRAGCLVFSVASLPFEFLPLAIAFSGKLRERREVDRAVAHLASPVVDAVGVAPPA
jgi:predicted metal-dependent phosphoesterase TrpH